MEGCVKNKPLTLCWRCAKACGRCSWSDGSFTPVEGWTAQETRLREQHWSMDADRSIQSFHVTACPLFEDDTDEYNKPVRRNKWNSEPYLKEVDA